MDDKYLLKNSDCLKISIPSIKEYKQIARYFREGVVSPFVTQVFYSNSRCWRLPQILLDGKEELIELKMLDKSVYKLNSSKEGSDNFCVRPQITIDVKDLLKDNSSAELLNNIKTQKLGLRTFKTIKIGEYPQTSLMLQECMELDKLFESKSPKLKSTGRVYTFFENRFGMIGSKLAPEFEYEGKRYVRYVEKPYISSAQSTVYWKIVEPLEWVIVSTPKMMKSSGELQAICIKSLFEFDFKRLNKDFQFYIDSITMFLNGQNASGVFGSYGNFANQVFSQNQQTLSDIVIPQDQKVLFDYAFSGCYFIKSLKVHENCKISQSALDNTNLRYVYKNGRELVITSEKVDSKNYFCDLQELKTIFPQISLEETRDVNQTVFKLYNILRVENISFDYSLVKKLMECGKLEEFVENSNFKLCKNSIRLCNEKFDGYFGDTDKYLALKLMFYLGCFSNKKVLDSSGKETNVYVAQLANEVFQAILKKGYDNFIVPPDDNVVPNMEYNQEALKFLLVRGAKNSYPNLEMISELSEDSKGLIYIFLSHFNEIKDLRVCLNDKGLPATRSWKDCISTYTAMQKYKYIPEGYEDLAREFASKGLNEYYFKKARDLFKVAHRSLIPHHILKTPLSEKTILEQIEEIKQQTDLSLIESKKLIDETYKKHFTFEMLDKYDPKGCIIGLYVDCCCTITSDVYGAHIASDTLLDYDVQHLVVKDYKNRVVGKGTLYINRDSGYGVFNNFEYNVSAVKKNEDGTNLENKVFGALMRGVKAFVTQYDQENPDNPIKKINVGMGYNNLAEQSRLYPKEWIKLSAPDEFKDAKNEQRILYERGKDFQIRTVEPEKLDD